MERRFSIGALVLSVVLMVSLLGASFAGEEQRERREEKEGEEGIITGDQSSSGDGGVLVVQSRDNFGEPEGGEETREHSRSDAEEETTIPPPHGQEEATAQSSDAAEAGVDAVVLPSAKVIIWDESVDLATAEPPNQGQASAAGGAAARERKDPPPSQERHSDVEALEKKEGEAGAGEESQIASEGRSQVNSAASSSLSSSSIWKTALFAVFGSTVLLFLMKNGLDSTSKQQSYNRCSNNSQCNRKQETSDRHQLTGQFTHHSSAPL